MSLNSQVDAVLRVFAETAVYRKFGFSALNDIKGNISMLPRPSTFNFKPALPAAFESCFKREVKTLPGNHGAGVLMKRHLTCLDRIIASAS